MKNNNKHNKDQGKTVIVIIIMRIMMCVTRPNKK